MQIELINLSDWPENYLLQTLEWIASDLHLRRNIKVLFQERWSEITDEGEIIPKTESEVAFDGDSFDNGVIRIVISRNAAFPFQWDINPQLPGDYLRKIVAFENRYELFLYLACHEMRHQFQFANPRKIKRICQLLDIDDEGDADSYAIKILSRWRCTTAAEVEFPADTSSSLANAA
jgi:hypothetical protein